MLVTQSELTEVFILQIMKKHLSEHIQVSLGHNGQC